MHSAGMSAAAIASWRIKVGWTILSSLVLGIGLLLVWAGGSSQMAKARNYAAWVKTPCTIETWEMRVEERWGQPVIYTQIRFIYEVGGKKYVGMDFDKTRDEEPDLREFEREGHKARQGPAFCYVDPADPRKSTFYRSRLWVPWALISVGAVLSLVGIVCIIITYLPKRKKDRPASKFNIGLMCIGFVLLGIGLQAGFRQNFFEAVGGLFVQTQMQGVSARIERNGVFEQQGSGRKRHMRYNVVQVIYSYEVNGRRWHSDRVYYDQAAVNGGSKESAQELAEEYPRGKEVTAWVMPDRPWLSTLKRGVNWTAIFFILPIGMLITGAWCIKEAWKPRR